MRTHTLSPAALLVVLATIMCIQSASAAAPQAKSTAPNIVVLLADDLGYGDLRCYNSESKAPTPNIDRLASQGIRFTDAHSASTVCTPSRYSLLTGRMCFRTGLRGVFTGVDGPLIERGRLTVAELLRRKGYATACVGKWHVGMTFLNHDGQAVAPRGGGLKKVQEVDFNRPIQDGPCDVGFDYFFGTACCPTTDWLYAFIENRRIVQAPDEIAKPEGGDWLEYEHFRAGLKAKNFDFRQVDLTFLEKSKRFLESHVREHPDQPFFLYHATQAVHLPAMPAPQFVRQSQAGPLGDFIVEFDYVAGELMKTLDQLGVADNTLFILSSDNGPEIVAAKVRKEFDHDSARPWRGFKRDDWEGGHRVPFIARWPGRIAAGGESNETICLTDLFATFAAITGSDYPADAGEDSYNILPALINSKRDAPVRTFTMHQTISNAMAIRSGPWKLLDHKGSGGNGYQGGFLKEYWVPDTEPDAPGQLYNLDTDTGETRNVYSEHPDIARRLKEQLEEFKATGRSAPGQGK